MPNGKMEQLNRFLIYFFILFWSYDGDIHIDTLYVPTYEGFSGFIAIVGNKNLYFSKIKFLHFRHRLLSTKPII